MAFQKGQSGNPGGRSKDKPWADALRVVGYREDAEGRKRLLGIAEKCYSAAEAGEIAAMKEIGDRLDGKPAQESMVTVRNELDSLNDAELRDFIQRELEASSAAGNGAAESTDTIVTH